MFRILSNNEFYTIHINNIQDWGEWDIYRLDNKGNIHIDIDNDELLELWEIKKRADMIYDKNDIFTDVTNKYIKYYYIMD